MPAADDQGRPHCRRGSRPAFGIEALTGPEHYPALVEALDRRGWSAEEAAAVTGGNLRFLRASL